MLWCGVGDKPEFSHENRRLRLLPPSFPSFPLSRVSICIEIEPGAARAHAATVTGDFAAGDKMEGEIQRKRALHWAPSQARRKKALIKMNLHGNEIIQSGDCLHALLSQKELFSCAHASYGKASGAPDHAFFVTLISLLLFSTNASSFG